MVTMNDHYQCLFSFSIKEWDIDQEKCVRSYKGTVCVVEARVNVNFVYHHLLTRKEVSNYEISGEITYFPKKKRNYFH